MSTLRIAVALTVLAVVGCKKKEPAAPAAAASKPSLATQLLPMKDAQALLSGSPASTPLAGIPESDHYASIRYASGAPYGLAVQVWRLGADADARYLKDLGSYPQAAAKDEVGTRSFRALRDGVLYVHFLDAPTATVVSLTCDVGTCRAGKAETPMAELRWETALGVARSVQGRLASLPPPPKPAPVAAPVVPALTPVAPAPAPAAPAPPAK